MRALASLRMAPALAAALSIAGCDGDRDVWTLYRNSPIDLSARVHWATFDADEPRDYNLRNCQMAADLLNKQAPRGIRWWCGAGRYRH